MYIKNRLSTAICVTFEIYQAAIKNRHWSIGAVSSAVRFNAQSFIIANCKPLFILLHANYN